MTDPEKQELKNDIKKDVLSELKAGSTSVQELEEVQTLDNIESLPAARGNDMVKVPIKLLEKPATDAAKNVEGALKDLKKVKDDAQAVADMKDNLTTLKQQAETAATEAKTAADAYKDTALAALHGATVRFSTIDTAVRSIETETATADNTDTIVYNTVAKLFLLQKGTKYHKTWHASINKLPASDMYNGESVLTDKIFVCNTKGKDKFYTFSQASGLVEFSGNNTGNTINMALIAPLPSGQYYTLDTAIKAVPEEYRGLLRCIT